MADIEIKLDGILQLLACDSEFYRPGAAHVEFNPLEPVYPLPRYSVICGWVGNPWPCEGMPPPIETITG